MAFPDSSAVLDKLNFSLRMLGTGETHLTPPVWVIQGGIQQRSLSFRASGAALCMACRAAFCCSLSNLQSGLGGRYERTPTPPPPSLHIALKPRLGRTPKGAYPSRRLSRHLLETPFSEPLLRTLLRTLF